MKVLYIASGDSKYGASHSMIEMMLSMKKYYGVEPILLTRKHNHLNVLCEKQNIENYSFWNRDIMAGSAYSNIFLNALKHTVKYLLFLYGGLTQKHIEQTQLDFSSIDLIHSNHNRNDIGAYIANIYSIPHIWHLRELGVEDYRVIFYKRKCVSYMNQHADKFIAISNCVKDAWIKRGIEESKINVIYNGIDLTKFQYKKKRTDNKVRIVMCGHIQSTKGQDQLIRALALFSHKYDDIIDVDFYGDAYPDYHRLLLSLVSKNNLEKIVHFQGYNNQIPLKLSEYDIGIVCSKAEGFGRVTVEYMAAGLAVIASDTGANPELIDNRINGLLYQYGNINDLALKLQSLIDNPIDLERISCNGRKKAYQKYTTEQNVANIYNLYKKLLG